eukprot:CAMPEP_0182599532 /NCGR_PEP_ID=MMETSP1324-20130603/90527_1 /TAXON_ID=236786 /ORGANISM="Florenciella sp., Strain RCC1587" /LENGTH=152 /DNA_ID=CAMNT_0024817431 /DNA_START=299 /DNA_END=758 /DNA_ORIENTATION=-
MRRGLQQVTLTLPRSCDLGRKPKEEPWSVRPATDDRLRAYQREEEKRGEAGAREAAYGQTPCGEGASLVTTWCHRDAAWPSASDADTAALGDLGRKPKEEPWSVRPATDDRLRAYQREEEKRGEAGAREDQAAAAANAAAADARAADATGKR